MFKSLLIAILCTFTTAKVFANEKGNGGGGIYRDGRYLTFAGARLLIEPLDESEVAGLKSFLDWINGHPLLHPSAKLDLSSTLAIGQNRTYYKIKADQLSEKLRAELIAEYRRQLRDLQENDGLVVYAITTKQNETFLLPEYDLLHRSDEKAAWEVLWHESHWIKAFDSSYKEVLRADAIFNKYVGKHHGSGFYLPFFAYLDRYLADATVSIVAGIRQDMIDKKLDSIVNADGTFSVETLFGPNPFLCVDPNRSTYIFQCYFPVEKTQMSNLYEVATVLNSNGLKRLAMANLEPNLRRSEYVDSSKKFVTVRNPVEIQSALVQGRLDLQFNLVDQYRARNELPVVISTGSNFSMSDNKGIRYGGFVRYVLTFKKPE